ncbi:ADP-heptose:LPS heptosyltransferase [Desulfocapsa sulfexigens DSM 10523]|uniref:ADP-heptose:LPS heptosyltransferase n=1 Tax=Desulfocapsa sulfexigens (strain DSM 10523 / SB164P1) TaxID=1167006 RepID=M1NGN4_DESSD|nr:glycosyltransferase family 9 protein [Desulfocapsa sulfexigens]AGF78799.1 ADP-heptose:LPS heptosyltransferase [Desulfocapsa sulfexigens DSM 10523]
MNLLYWIKWLLHPVRVAFFAVVDWCAALTAARHEEASDAVLLIRVDAIGDFVLWLDSAKSIREHYVNQRIILTCNKVCVDLAAASVLFDEVHGVDLTRFTKDLRYRWRTMREVSWLGASLAIQPTFSRVLLTGDALIKASGAPLRIGSTGDLANRHQWHKWIGDRWYTSLVPASVRPLMELDRNSEFLRGLGIEQAVSAVAKMPVVAVLPSAKYISSAYFVIFPGASATGRMWPAGAFAKVADAVHDLYGWQPVACGSKADRAIAAEMIKYSNCTNWVDFTGDTTLLEFVEILRGAQLVVGNETSVVHIAASVATPSVCVLGGGHFGRFMPYSDAVSGMKPIAVYRQMECFGCNWKCHIRSDISRPYPCVEAVNISDIISTVKTVIDLEELDR